MDSAPADRPKLKLVLTDNSLPADGKCSGCPRCQRFAWDEKHLNFPMVDRLMFRMCHPSRVFD